MTTRMTINGVSTCADGVSVSNRVSEDAGGHLCSTTTATP